MNDKTDIKRETDIEKRICYIMSNPWAFIEFMENDFNIKLSFFQKVRISLLWFQSCLEQRSDLFKYLTLLRILRKH